MKLVGNVLLAWGANLGSFGVAMASPCGVDNPLVCEGVKPGSWPVLLIGLICAIWVIRFYKK